MFKSFYWNDNEAVYRTLFPGIEIHEGIILNNITLLIHGHKADPKCSGEAAAVSKFFVHNFWPDLQRCGVKDPTRAALNPGLCNEVDKRLHDWANHNDQGISAIIAGHTHRAVFESLSLTERRYLESRIKTEGIKIKHQSDGSYYNTGSCVHPLSITGIEITFDGGPHLRLVEWGQATDGNALTIQRTEV